MDELARLSPAAPAAPSLEAQLVAAAQAGDRAAYGRLYDRFAPMVHGLLLARVPRGDVEDLVQDVFLQAMRRLSSLRSAEAFGGWLATIARNRARDHWRRGLPLGRHRRAGRRGAGARGAPAAALVLALGASLIRRPAPGGWDEWIETSRARPALGRTERRRDRRSAARAKDPRGPRRPGRAPAPPVAHACSTGCINSYPRLQE